MGKIERGLNNKFYWVFEDEDEAEKVYPVIKFLRFFGLRCPGACFGGYYNAWELF